MDHETPFLASEPNRARPLHRRQFTSLALSGVAAMALSACGGGSSDSSNGDLDLRAAYDRITEGMNHADVDRAVGAPNEYPNDTTRVWHSGNEALTVGFVRLNSGSWVVGSAQWTLLISGGGQLTKEFGIDF